MKKQSFIRQSSFILLLVSLTAISGFKVNKQNLQLPSYFPTELSGSVGQQQYSIVLGVKDVQEFEQL
ncbi:MAG: hypothetical protein ICV66_14025, partial [Chitinophagaceae bacterium]|nr:hypothetical protein [Chitinophagaceae bacterium]